MLMIQQSVVLSGVTHEQTPHYPTQFTTTKTCVSRHIGHTLQCRGTVCHCTILRSKLLFTSCRLCQTIQQSILFVCLKFHYWLVNAKWNACSDICIPCAQVRPGCLQTSTHTCVRHLVFRESDMVKVVKGTREIMWDIHLIHRDINLVKQCFFLPPNSTFCFDCNLHSNFNSFRET